MPEKLTDVAPEVVEPASGGQPITVGTPDKTPSQDAQPSISGTPPPYYDELTTGSASP